MLQEESGWTKERSLASQGDYNWKTVIAREGWFGRQPSALLGLNAGLPELASANQ